MGIFDSLLKSKPSASTGRLGAIDYGKQKADGTHDHRTNKGSDRTPAQKKGDKARSGK